MAAVEQLSAPGAVSAYCRQARRLRGRLSRQPARMHRELRGLSLQQGAGSVPPPPAPRSKIRVFADAVADGLDGSVLRYAQRRRLISMAREVGIGDFEANLIIAAVQHQRRRTGESEPPSEPPSDSVGRARDAWWVAPVVVFVAVEALVALGAWKVFLA